jgi:hypothetical protein
MMKVYKAINEIQLALSKDGITKNRKNVSQGYNFRGIDDVLNAISPLLAEYGLCIIPRVVDRQVVERQTKNGGAMFYTTLTVEYDFVSSEDGSKHTAVMVGEAMDSGDKSSNKAMSAAYKYACIQVFSIPTEGDNDADLHTHEIVAKPVKTLADHIAKINNSKTVAGLKANYVEIYKEIKDQPSLLVEIDQAKDLKKLELEAEHANV